MRRAAVGVSATMDDRALSTRQNSNPLTGSYGREARILRDRHAAHADSLDRAAGKQQPFSSARLAVQVYNGGSMPSSLPAVFFTHPVLITGSETEGGSGTLTADTATTVPVVFIGSTVPSVGDYATAYAVGCRWVAERGGSSGGGSVPCSPCNIPAENLTISWTNPLSGDGSATMIYNSGTELWTTGCVDGGFQFRLGCNAGTLELRAIFFTGGGCPNGTSNFCSNLRSAPLTLTFSTHTCSPFSLAYTVAESGCPALFSPGNTQFVITL
jgi:hypothetical protein